MAFEKYRPRGLFSEFYGTRKTYLQKSYYVYQ